MKPYYQDASTILYHGDCLDVMAAMEPASVDAIVTDPPYPCIDRAYGRWTEPEWHDLMHQVVAGVRRVLKPNGSAVFVLQPNSERVGRLRPWLWDFLAWASREWNIVQDAWWWNYTTAPLGGAPHAGLLRPSLKMCVWLGPPECYRNQEAVLWSESQRSVAIRTAIRAGGKNRIVRRGENPSDTHLNTQRAHAAAERRDGVTPFNVLPLDNGDHYYSGGARGHGAATPLALCEWWIRYLTKPGASVLDPFAGSGTVGAAAVRLGRRATLIELEQHSCDVAVDWLRTMPPPALMFDLEDAPPPVAYDVAGQPHCIPCGDSGSGPCEYHAKRSGMWNALLKSRTAG